MKFRGYRKYHIWKKDGFQEKTNKIIRAKKVKSRTYVRIDKTCNFSRHGNDQKFIGSASEPHSDVFQHSDRIAPFENICKSYVMSDMDV